MEIIWNYDLKEGPSSIHLSSNYDPTVRTPIPYHPWDWSIYLHENHKNQCHPTARWQTYHLIIAIMIQLLMSYSFLRTCVIRTFPFKIGDTPANPLAEVYPNDHPNLKLNEVTRKFQWQEDQETLRFGMSSWVCDRNYMDVSKNMGTPKSSILIGFSIINHPFWGTPIFGNTHMDLGGVLKYFFIFTPIWGRFPIWLIFFRWVETTNKYI